MGVHGFLHLMIDGEVRDGGIPFQERLERLEITQNTITQVEKAIVPCSPPEERSSTSFL